MNLSLACCEYEDEDPTDDIIALLPAKNLTALNLGSSKYRMPSLPDSFSQLSDLRKLKLTYAEVNPIMLLGTCRC